MIDKIKRYLCNADPIDVTGCSILSIMILGFIGTGIANAEWKMLGGAAIAAGICALGFAAALSIYKGTKFLQGKCKEELNEPED